MASCESCNLNISPFHPSLWCPGCSIFFLSLAMKLATDWQMMIVFGDHVVQSAKKLALTKYSLLWYVVASIKVMLSHDMFKELKQRRIWAERLSLGVASAWRCHDQPRGWQLQTTCRPRHRTWPATQQKATQFQLPNFYEKYQKVSAGLGSRGMVTAQMPKNDKKKAERQRFSMLLALLGLVQTKKQKDIDWECLAILPINVYFWACSSIVNCPQSF